MTHKKKLSGKERWFTPPYILQAARMALGGGFTLDPATEKYANDYFVGAARILTKEDNALERGWQCSEQDRVWFNPPYSRGVIKPFVMKFLRELKGARAAVLVNSDTGTEWYQMLLEQCTYAVIFKKRLAFYDPEANKYVSGNAMASTLFLFNTPVETARSVWAGYGQIVVTLKE